MPASSLARLVPSLGIYGPTFGVIVGAILQTLILLPGLRGRGALYRPSLDIHDPRLREVVRLLIPNGLAVGVGYAGFILDTAFASKAREMAGLPAIANAWLLVGLPIALLGQAIGQSAFPRIAAHAASLDYRKMLRTVLISLGIAVGLALPALAAFYLLGRPLVHLLFEHGKFDAAAGTLTFNVLKVYASALPAYVGAEVVTRGLIAMRDTRTPLLTNTAQLLSRALMMSLLITTRGVLAIPLSMAVMASLETMVLLVVLLLKVRQRLRLPNTPVVTASAVPSSAFPKEFPFISGHLRLHRTRRVSLVLSAPRPRISSCSFPKNPIHPLLSVFTSYS